MAFFSGALAISAGKWVLGQALGFVGKRVDAGVAEVEAKYGFKAVEVNAKAAEFESLQQSVRVLAGEGTKRQAAKFNFKIFWIFIGLALGPAIFHLWSLQIYNVCCWENGIWPQPWGIAEFPAQSAAWVNMSIEWLFDPVGLGTTIGGGGVMGYITRKR